MADTISIAGHKVSKWVVYGGAAVVGVGGILYFRSKSSAAAAAATTASTTSAGTDPVTGLPYSMDNEIDPATGMTYLSEAQEYGSVAAAEAAVSAGYGATSDTSEGYSGLGYGYPTYETGSTTGSTSTYTSNAQWVQAVTAGLTALGYNGSDVGAALGLYLLSMPLSSTQVTIVQTAVAEYGPPPVGTFAIIASPASQTGSTTPPANGTCPSGYTFSSTQTGAAGEIAATGGAGWCELNKTTTTPPVTTTTPPVNVTKAGGNPLSQTGTVHSATTGETGQVVTSNGGYTWTYVGTGGASKTLHQTGTVHSATTGGSANVVTENGGETWTYVS